MCDVQKWDFEKAVPVTDCKSVVYVMQFTEDIFPFTDFSQANIKVYVLELCGDIHFIRPDQWLVWFPDIVKYDFLDDEEFRDKYTLYQDLPPAIKEMADKHPSYQEWVQLSNLNETVVN